jgi:pSer/pThr/pTyr-binding forkhead associated (FHA) protein
MQYLTVPSYTPVATPVVPAPLRKPEERQRDVRPRAELCAPVTVITPQGELELGSGSLLIGRLPECDVLLTDNLVSRMHARISVQGESVVVEDLHSTNGVYVNGLRVGHSTVLCEGDRILVGTSEFSLFESRDSSLMRIRAARPAPPPADERVTPWQSPLASVAAKGAPRIASGVASALKVPTNLERVPSTARADALKMIGGLADRLAATGNLEEAAQVLSGHLRRILKGANSGLTVTPEVAGSAAHHALTLARWTKLPLWADYVVELHLSARLVMNAVTLAAFEDAVSKLDFDRMLLGYYVDSLKDRLEKLDMDERRRVERLRFLAQETR